MYLPNNLNRALIIALVIAPAVQAAEWSAEPAVSLRAGYNDNIRMSSGPHDSVLETALSPSVKFGVAREHQGLSGDAGLVIRRFSGGSGRESSDILDREDYHLNTTAYHTTLKDRFRVNLNYSQDSALDSELDAGIVTESRATRNRIALGPSWSRSLNELTRLDLSYQFTNIDYSDDPGSPDLVPYDYHSLSSSLAYQFSPRMTTTLSATYSSYRPDTRINSDSDTVALQAGLSRNFSETLNASVLVGQRRTTADAFFRSGFCIGADPGATFPTCTGGIPISTGIQQGEVQTNAPVYSASINKELETGLLSATLSRTSQPSSNGELLDSIRLVLAGNYRITETVRSAVRIEYTDNETIVNRVNFIPAQTNRTFIRFVPTLSWRWVREWELTGEYQYARNEQANGQKADRNAFYLTLTYRPTKISVSR